MNEVEPGHLWLRGGRRADRAAVAARWRLAPEVVPVVDAHRALRGPYTAAGTIARALVPPVLGTDPGLVTRHDIELLSAAPELNAVVPNSRETLTSMALPQERTRFYARLRTLRIAHGLVEFLRDATTGPRTLFVENVEHAAVTDVEFLATALRRIDPAHIRIVVCSGSGEVHPTLAAMLTGHTRTVPVEPGTDDSTDGTEGESDAESYIRSDCTSDVPALRRAYERLPAAERATLHDRRAAELEGTGEFSLCLGAVTLHRERGSDPAGAGAQALYRACDHCICAGFYDAVVDYGRRGLAVIEPRAQERLWWMFTIELTLALSILGRTHEAMALYDGARLFSTRPDVHMAAAYSTAMLYTRHNDPGERDEKKAKAWLHAAIATASLLADRAERAFQSAFYKNGLALVEVNLGDPAEALRLVDECIDDLDRLLEPDEHRLHRSVLKNNRARVYASLGRLEEAVADYGVIIAADPHHSELYLERGNLLRRLGRNAAAAADYATAMTLTPPFPEIHYNRGDLRLSEGDAAGALADFDYVLELDPDFVDAYVNRAGIELEAGDLDAALRTATAGLVRDPDNPHLLVVTAQCHAERGRPDQARGAFDRALREDPDLVPALSGRAALACEAGDHALALADLGRAIAVAPDDPALRYNRAYLHRLRGSWAAALEDIEVAAAADPDDPDVAELRATCRDRPAVL